MKKKLIQILLLLKKKRKRISWQMEVCLGRFLYRRKCSIQTLNYGARYLILMPHADDEWIGCSQIIQKCENLIICNMDMPGGDDANVHEVRRNESINLAGKMNRKFVDVFDFHSLKSVIDVFKPDYICTPSCIDWHEEHIQVNHILERTLVDSSYECNVLSYQVSVPIPVNRCNAAISMSKDEVKKKWDCFKKYFPSQTVIQVLRFIANERINGSCTGTYAAEVYHVLQSNNWIDWKKDMEQQSFVFLKNHINCLMKIRKLVKAL